MPAAARANGVDTVYSLTGTAVPRHGCPAPFITRTGTGSPNVFIAKIPAVRLGDIVGAHPNAACSLDASPLTTGSAIVRINGLPAGRIGDQYTLDNIITSGCPTVFFA